MAARSSIEWTDTTWNPVTGCTKVSPGCDHCYAETFAERWRGTSGHHFERGFDIVLRPEQLALPLRWRRPRRIFVNSMSDLFHQQVPDLFIARVFAVMAIASRHTFQVLTKRHGRMRSLLSSPSFGHLVAEQGRGHHVGCQQDWLAVGAMLGGQTLPNVWLGVSVEDQKRAGIRIPALLDTPAAVRFVSAEPLLGAIDLDRADPDARVDGGIDWVIAGGESGPKARPMHPDWVRSLRDQCAGADIPFFFKQWGEWAPGAHPTRPAVWVDQHGVAHSESGAGRTLMSRWGRKHAGDRLDGYGWDEMPAHGAHSLVARSGSVKGSVR